MLPAEDILLGRLEENSDPSHPSFIPNIEDFFLTRVDKSPIEKFNILSSYLCRKIEKKLKDNSKTYKITQQRYIKFEENLQKNNQNQNKDFSPLNKFYNVLKAVSQSKEESWKKKES